MSLIALFNYGKIGIVLKIVQTFGKDSFIYFLLNNLAAIFLGFRFSQVLANFELLHILSMYL